MKNEEIMNEFSPRNTKLGGAVTLKVRDSKSPPWFLLRAETSLDNSSAEKRRSIEGIWIGRSFRDANGLKKSTGELLSYGEPVLFPLHCCDSLVLIINFWSLRRSSWRVWLEDREHWSYPAIFYRGNSEVSLCWKLTNTLLERLISPSL